MHRGEIWWAALLEPRKSEPGFSRPVIIIQTDEFNRSRINTVVTVALTSNLKLAKAPGNVFLPHKETGLPKDSVANVSQVITLDKTFLVSCAGALPRPFFRRVEAGLRLVLGL